MKPENLLTRRRLLAQSAVGIAAIALPSVLQAAPPALAGGADVFARLARMSKETRWAPLPIGVLVGEIGLALVGTPYVGGTLEVDDDRETCVVNLAGLDCVTFYEVALGFARILRLGAPLTPARLIAEVEKMRYRGGHADGYLSRLHYTSDWLYDNNRRGIVKLASPLLPGAIPLDKELNFMSSHPTAYRQLKAHPEWVKKLAAMEHIWSMRKTMYVPNDVVPMVESLLETGDILGIATSAPGLDTSHTGLCYRDHEGALRILHASSAHKKVELGPRLVDYLASVKKDIGILVARPMEPVQIRH